MSGDRNYDTERAECWDQVAERILSHNPKVFHGGKCGLDCILDEIDRLYARSPLNQRSCPICSPVGNRVAPVTSTVVTP